MEERGVPPTRPQPWGGQGWGGVVLPLLYTPSVGGSRRGEGLYSPPDCTPSVGGSVEGGEGVLPLYPDPSMRGYGRVEALPSLLHGDS